jgi:hypothetical protein
VGVDPRNPGGALKKYDYALLLERLDEGIALMGVELDLPFRLLPSIAANPNTAVRRIFLRVDAIVTFSQN